MGSVVSFVKGHGRRLINRYNAQYRALKFIERDNLPVAPRHPLPETLRGQDVASAGSYTHSKSEQLNEYLKTVYIRSYGEVKEESSRTSNRPMPQYMETERTMVFPEPEVVTPGYCTITQAVKFIVDHYEDPETNSAQAIAENLNLNVHVVENILKYHTIFQAHDMGNLSSIDAAQTGGLEGSGGNNFWSDLTAKNVKVEGNILEMHLKVKELLEERSNKHVKGEGQKKMEEESERGNESGEKVKKEYQSGS